MLNQKQYAAAKNLLGIELNEYEYFDHIVIQDDTYYFAVIHLNGNQRLVPVNDILIGKF